MDNIETTETPAEETTKKSYTKKKFAIQLAAGMVISAGVHFALAYFDKKSQSSDETTDN